MPVGILSDEIFMRRAIELAKLGTGHTNPNPLVGAVIVKDGVIIGEGYHHVYGDLHAERDALKDCREKNNDPAGATIYVTLEPCCHFGKQPPCTHAVKEAGISKVIIGSRDPNPLVSGKGTEYLRQNGIEVIEDFLREECDSINEIFFHYITTKTPFVALKYAMTMDGKIATKTGESKWISGEKSREHAHSLRNKYTCIMAGIRTVLADDPMLNCRIPGGRNPVRVICDSSLKIPLESNIVKTAKDIPTIVACTNDAAIDSKENINSNTITTDSRTNTDGNTITRADKIAALQKAGIEVFATDGDKVDLKALMAYLAEKKLDSVLIEGGGEINFSALKAGIVNKVYAYIAPQCFGGSAASPVGGTGIEKVCDSFKFKVTDTKMIDGDVLVEYRAIDGNTDTRAVKES
ncbi:MAG: bifunctional diaminohydroxyphosphoribosylaminopyrimidine deaminase/5-amino-6-(5-phosphoribosylamino)uracil reductase RibD [Treponema sp.]|uniref:bifunctional diaminohydroxyphosphoribosylaminopyrimidine deaminase/5-amino-6-(5-phosphoribosylamino)uracil reductase RibD n=1 Tax=Treponema sp. TaxID=166 RepID=UPI00298EB5F8|nr:bifunctional diaminohydroxyphosphoribosylaminopyrimidine deaminase/5-amino-6-(5-phosphoribosylamino)uracil reductase RibD [Treponema sp.]MCQ2600598.1 bifunctional diaminohydroxyphosphoribosylaminopyrimidine deaminase/5-amino-6-(5-phosphoribosylamino)uracil reductase RibD [Treponema sp.]